MQTALIKPLYSQEKTKIWLYSLKGWDFKEKVQRLCTTTVLGNVINRINRAAIECIYASSFFQFCKQVSIESDLYAFISTEMPKKTWLFELSQKRDPIGLSVSQFFDNQSSLFNFAAKMDVAHAYSLMQYVEGYYLIREIVKNALIKGEGKIECIFALPNDEGKYYRDLSLDMEKLLKADFGDALTNFQINICFKFFKYKKLKDRPYIEKNPLAQKVTIENIEKYFPFLLQKFQEHQKTYPPRDIIHNLNGWC